MTKVGFSGRPGGGSAQKVRDRAAALGIPTDHFTRKRSGPERGWSDGDLREAVRSSRTWTEVVEKLSSSHSTVRRHADRMDLDISHLEIRNHMAEPGGGPAGHSREELRLSAASEPLAMAWYSLHGFEVFVPVAGDGHADLVVKKGDSFVRVQVKSTRRSGIPTLRLVCRAPGERSWRPYRPDEIDEVFAVTGEGKLYIFPIATVEGKSSINLGKKYEKYRVEMFPAFTAT